MGIIVSERSGPRRARLVVSATLLVVAIVLYLVTRALNGIPAAWPLLFASQGALIASALVFSTAWTHPFRIQLPLSILALSIVAALSAVIVLQAVWGFPYFEDAMYEGTEPEWLMRLGGTAITVFMVAVPTGFVAFFAVTLQLGKVETSSVDAMPV